MQSFKKMKVMLAAAVALVAFGAVAATVALAEGGPYWIVKCHAVLGANLAESRWEDGACTKLKVAGGNDRRLYGGENKNIAKIAAVSAVQKLKSPAVTIECETIGLKPGTANKINGGNPGTDEATLVFTKCHVAGKPGCAATSINPLKAANIGEIVVAVKTLLGYAKGKTEGVPIYDQFFPDPGPKLFVQLEFTGSTCGALNNTTIEVTATGSEYTGYESFEKSKTKCGAIAEVGKINAKNEFESAVSGELTKLGGLRLPEKAITEEEVWNPKTKKFEVIKCGLNAAGNATQTGESSIELEGAEEFGVEV
ncbi:MAG TPA: hypothetical protein VNY52_04110 [Solirubrobacteraceae bacterium]|jgi:hypothetical protein|nr:hypothetical protein [Solirubrobacteraceae bacterium]